MTKRIKNNFPIIVFLVFMFWPIIKSKIGFVVFILIFLFIVLKNIGLKKFSLSNIHKKRMSKTIDLDSLGLAKNIKHRAFSVMLLILAIWLFFASIVIIDAGQVGVYSLFGKVNSNELSSGFHLVIPFAKVTKMSVRTEEYTMSITQGEGKKYSDDSITSLTKEGLEVSLDMTVLYHLNDEMAAELYEKVGLEYDEKIIRPAIRTIIREIVASYEAKDLYSEKRAEAANKILENLKNVLDSRGVITEEVLLRNVALPDNLARSIQEKLQAEQEAEKYDFLLTREEKEKERKKIEAEGQRDAQAIINESLSDRYLYYQYIKELKDREGTIYVPTSPSTGMPLFRNIGR